jgi:hypothetical protein
MRRHHTILALLPVVAACGATVVVADGVPPAPSSSGHAEASQGGSPGSPPSPGTGGAPSATTSTTSSGSTNTGSTATSSGTTNSATAATSSGTTSTGSTTSGGQGGGAPPSTGSSGGAGGQDAGTVTVGPGFHLVGAYWNGSVVVVDLVDPTTGQGALLGQLGQLGGWSPNLVLSRDGTRLYGIGNPHGSFANKLVTLDLTSGTWSDVTTAQAQMYVLAGVTDDEHVVGVFWNGSAEEVDLVDPTTGVGASVGQLGDLHTWPDQPAYDHEANIVYAWGWNQANDQFLYGLNVVTHVSQAVPVSLGNWSYPLGGVAPSGAVVGMTWNGAAEVVMSLDPMTGISMPQGTLLGLHDIAQWGAITYDGNAGIAYAIGMPDGSNTANTLYTLDLATSQGASVLAAHAYTLARP